MMMAYFGPGSPNRFQRLPTLPPIPQLRLLSRSETSMSLLD